MSNRASRQVPDRPQTRYAQSGDVAIAYQVVGDGDRDIVVIPGFPSHPLDTSLPCGVIGTRKFAYDVWGDTVNVASRVEQSGVAGRVHVSDATKNLTQDHFSYEPRRGMELEGIDSMTTYLVLGPKAPGPAMSVTAHEVSI